MTVDLKREPSLSSPVDPAPAIDRAVAALAAGRLEEALLCARTTLDHDPDHAMAHCIVGQIAIFMRRPSVGLEALRRSVALQPRPYSRIWLSLCLEQLGFLDEARREIDAAAESASLDAGAQFAIGLMLEKLGCNTQALRFYTACLALDPDHAEGHHHLGRSLQVTGRNEEAVVAYRQAIRCCATRASYYTDLSAALSDLGRFDEALDVGEIAVVLNPESVEGHNNNGHALLNLNRSAEAVAVYDRALDVQPGYLRARFGRALALLKCGDFARGWPDYELRWQQSQTPRLDVTGPDWRGEDIAGQTILLHAEQGFGDTLQFVRFAPLVAARGARVILEVPGPLVRLMRQVDGVADVVACGDLLPPTDLHCPMLSLPLALGTRLDTIPARPYLRLPEDSMRQGTVLRDRAAGRGTLVVGLVWAGDPRKTTLGRNLIDRRRSATLEAFAPLWAVEGVSFVSFQLGEAREEIQRCGRPICDAMEGVGDFADTAAILSGVDLLISVDTAMVHLAAGLGLPVWMLSRFDRCWRWLEGRDTTPWYPSMRIFQQPSLGDWSGMMADVAAALGALSVGGRSDRGSLLSRGGQGVGHETRRLHRLDELVERADPAGMGPRDTHGLLDLHEMAR